MLTFAAVLNKKALLFSRALSAALKPFPRI
jgi:hypothetical protein